MICKRRLLFEIKMFPEKSNQTVIFFVDRAVTIYLAFSPKLLLIILSRKKRNKNKIT